MELNGGGTNGRPKVSPRKVKARALTPPVQLSRYDRAVASSLFGGGVGSTSTSGTRQVDEDEADVSMDPELATIYANIQAAPSHISPTPDLLPDRLGSITKEGHPVVITVRMQAKANPAEYTNMSSMLKMVTDTYEREFAFEMDSVRCHHPLTCKQELMSCLFVS